MMIKTLCIGIDSLLLIDLKYVLFNGSLDCDFGGSIDDFVLVIRE